METVDPNAPQRLQITIEFKVKHSPGNDEHLKRIAQNAFRGKGWEMGEDLVVRI